MKKPTAILAFFLALFCATRVLPARAASETEIIAAEIENLIPAIRAIEDENECDMTLGSMAMVLAASGEFETARQINAAISDSAIRRKNHDVVWRYTSKQLAWQGNIAAATRSANRIQAEYSRADALLAIARAYSRSGDSAAAQRVLNRALPTIRATQSPHALSYLAYLFAQSGDAKTTRELFAQARTFPYSNEFERNESYDGRRAIVAYYQAKCGWHEEAIATAGDELSNLQQAKSVLIARREWELLRDFADKLSTPQAIEFLLELSGAQLQAEDSAAARASLETAKSRFVSLSREEQKSETEIPTQIRLALLEIANGDEEGHARFAEISQSPHFSARWELAFYYSLIEPRNQKVLQSSTEQRISYEQKAIAALTQIQDQMLPVDLHSIARAQAARGDSSAVRQTLQAIKSELRAELIAPLGEDESQSLRRGRAANQLLNLAHSERDAGLDYRTTLAQSQTLLNSLTEYSWASSPYLFAEHMMRLEFFDEAVQFLQGSGFENADWESLELLPARAGIYAVRKGVRPAVSWAKQFKNTSARAIGLTAIAIYLSRPAREKTGFSLSGNKKDGAKIQGSFSSDYRPLFEVAHFRVRE